MCVAEVPALAGPSAAAAVCICGGVAFAAALALRIARRYPGHPEPLLLDAWGAAAGIAAGTAFAAGAAPLLLRALAPPVAILPHIAYILAHPDLPRPGSHRRQG